MWQPRSRWTALLCLAVLAGLATSPLQAASEYPWDEENICYWGFVEGPNKGKTGRSLTDERFALEPPNHKNGTLAEAHPREPKKYKIYNAELFKLAPSVWEMVVEPRTLNQHCTFVVDTAWTTYDCTGPLGNGAQQVCIKLGPELRAANRAFYCGCEGGPNELSGFIKASCYEACASNVQGCSSSTKAAALLCLISAVGY